MNAGRFTNKLFNYLRNIKAVTELIEEIRKDIVEIDINSTEIWQKEMF